MTTLVRAILEQRAADPSRRPPRGDVRLRPDHLLVGPDASAFVLPLAFSARGPGAAPARSVAWSDRAVRTDTGLDDDLRPLLEAARKLGVTVLAPARDGGEARYREALAAPGRITAMCDVPDRTCGALATLPWTVTPLEAAALLAGMALERFEPPVRRVRVEGAPAPGVRGTDLALLVAARLGAAVRGAIVEFEGGGIAYLTMPDRFAAAHLLACAGAEAALFPSDAVTRERLRAWGRDSDWRELGAGGATGTVDVDLDLATLEPQVGPWSDPALAWPLRQAIERPLRGIVLGPLADEADIAEMARRLGGEPVANGLALHVVPGSAGARAALEAAGALEAVRRAGGAVFEATDRWELPRTPVPGTWLALGPDAAMRAALGDRAWVASADTCAVSARSGVLADPRAGAEVLDVAGPAPDPAGDRALPPVRPDGEPDAATPAPRIEPVRGALRGVVWIDAGEDCDAEHVLPRGARTRRMPTAERNAALFAARDGWSARDTHSRDGLVVAGRRFGGGAAADEAAWMLRHAGVRAVIATSLAAGAARALAYAGILPLETAPRGARSVAAPGEEIEIPSLPDAVEPGHPAGIRNLTRGTQDALRHALDARLVAVWRAGGLLAEANH